MKFFEHERILNVLSSIKGFGGRFGFFLERNIKRAQKVLRKVYFDGLNRTEVEQKFLDARDAIMKKFNTVIETDAEKEFEKGKEPFIAILSRQLPATATAEDRQVLFDEQKKAQEGLDAFLAVKKNKKIADGLDAKYQAIQDEMKVNTEENKDLQDGINAKLQAINETEVEIDYFKLDASDIPDALPRNISRELDALIN